MKKYVIAFFLLMFSFQHAQDKIRDVLTLSEYLGYVKRYHPIVKQANLTINKSAAKLLKARGAFDPKIEIDFDKKRFKENHYYTHLNGSFKIPTWYGIALKANFEQNEGLYLNPENQGSINGLYTAGIEISLARGLLTNNRMTTLKQAKLFLNQAQEERQIAVNKILYNASLSYFKWLKSYMKNAFLIPF